MHTSGLVVTFNDDPIQVENAREKLTSAGPYILQETAGNRLAAVLEVTDPRAAHDWHDWAVALPGVAGVEVVFVHWDEFEAEATHEQF